MQPLEYGNVAEIAAGSEVDLKSYLGKAAPLFDALTHGIHPDPLRPLFPEATVRVRHRFEQGLDTLRDIGHVAGAMAAKAAKRLGTRCCRVLPVALEAEGGLRLEAREARRFWTGGASWPRLCASRSGWPRAPNVPAAAQWTAH